jgi:hypothetical protein
MVRPFPQVQRGGEKQDEVHDAVPVVKKIELNLNVTMKDFLQELADGHRCQDKQECSQEEIDCEGCRAFPEARQGQAVKRTHAFGLVSPVAACVVSGFF